MGFVVAIDGPSGTGKGTITSVIAKKLGLINIDTGATYRCVTLVMLRKGIRLDQEDKIIEISKNIKIEFRNINGEQKVFLDGEDVSELIRQKDVTDIVSPVSAIKEVRVNMVALQRELAKDKPVIMEGRDITTYVFPNADVKIYLDAEDEERAKRRYKQNLEKGINMSYEEVVENIKSRDKRDKEKEMGALKIADDAVFIDTTTLTIEEVVEKVESLIRKSDRFCEK